jgi:hypothetical protein
VKRAIVLLLPVTAALVAGLYTGLSAPPEPVHSFYETTAQVIPVLIVALAVESPARAIFEGQTSVYRILVFLFLLIGESCALLGASGVFRGGLSANSEEFQNGVVADTSWGTHLLAAGTVGGLVGGFAMIAVLTIFGASDPSPEQKP